MVMSIWHPMANDRDCYPEAEPEAPELEMCDHCHGHFDPVELHRVCMDFLCNDCYAEYVTDPDDFGDETLADMLFYRSRVL